jgi:hypothetical protein
MKNGSSLFVYTPCSLPPLSPITKLTDKWLAVSLREHPFYMQRCLLHLATLNFVIGGGGAVNE